MWNPFKVHNKDSHSGVFIVNVLGVFIVDYEQVNSNWVKANIYLHPFQVRVAFQIGTSHLICTANQMTGFYMKWKLGWNRSMKCFSLSPAIDAGYRKSLKWRWILPWNMFNLLSANPTKWSNSLKQFVGNSQRIGNCLSVFDHFVG